MRAVGYVRVSMERQVERWGLPAQEHEVRAYARFRGASNIEVYREEGVSGYLRDRPALARLREDATARRFDTVIFPSIDRAGRSVRDVADLDEFLRKAGVAVVYVREGIDTATPTGELFRNIMASLAEFEGRLIAERLGRGRQRKKAAGGYVGGNRPYGSLDGEAEVRARIRASAGTPLRQIARALEADGVRPRSGRHWSVSTIRSILLA